MNLRGSAIVTSSASGRLAKTIALSGAATVQATALGDVVGSGKNYLFDTQSPGVRTNERDLLMRLNQEVIAQQGVEVYFLPNKYSTVDSLFGEDRTPLLNTAKKIVMYIKDAYNGMAGGAVYSKFGFSNQQTMDLVVSVLQWETTFPSSVPGNAIRPMEGDIIYLPRWSKWGPTDFLKINFVDKFDANGYFPLGEHYAFELSCEKWSYSSEQIRTGVPEIDIQEAAFTNEITINSAFEASPESQNATIQTKANTVLDFSAENPFGLP
jgi:hypothetical protein